MKKVLALLLTLLMLIAVSSVAMAEEKLTVVATTYPLYDMARNICGELVDVVYAPENAKEAAAEADIVLCISDGMNDLQDTVVVNVLDGLDVIDGDSDALTIPVNCMLAATYLADALNELDNENNSVYQDNLIDYISVLSAVDFSMQDVAAGDIVVDCADGSMAYFAREYGVKYEPGAEDAIVLSTYNFPAEDDMEVPYAELMGRNLAALQG